MGRPTKQGLSYFSMDVDFFNDIKVRKLIKYQGGKAITVYAFLLCNIYKDGYYMKWDKELPFVISESTGYDEAYIQEVIKCCLGINLFSKEMFEKNEVLTSMGIQIRYEFICKTSKKKAVISEYDLINTEETPINTEESAQSKVKEIKGNKREREKDKIPAPENQFFIPISEIEMFMCSDQGWCEVMCMQNHLNHLQLKQKIKEFVEKLRAENVKEKHRNDCFSHFSNWLKVQKQSVKQKSNITKLTGQEVYEQF